MLCSVVVNSSKFCSVHFFNNSECAGCSSITQYHSVSASFSNGLLLVTVLNSPQYLCVMFGFLPLMSIVDFFILFQYLLFFLIALSSPQETF